ncbi:SGS-domain-containing protein [Hypoxylon crocopeplum]|nr:SGS-domain-containing protein [Hypoxylon crocopeplum]
MPSSTVVAAEGVQAVAAGKYAEGIDKLSQALEDHPAPLWLLERSKAYVRTNELDLALHDAENALHIAFQRANRDHMVEAQIRRAITLFRLERYADADVCAFWALRLLDKAKATEDDGQQNKVDENGEYTVRVKEVKDANKPAKDLGLATALGGGGGRSKDSLLRNQAISWRLQALTRLETLPVGHHGRKVTIWTKYPESSDSRPSGKAEQKPAPADLDNDDDHATKPDSASGNRDKDGSWEILWKRFLAVREGNTIRSSFYQTETTFNADFFVKNVPAAQFSVNAESQKVIMGPVPNVHPGSIQLHLWGKIKPTETKHTVKSMKIELVLKKETPGKWPALQCEEAENFSNIVANTKLHPSLQQFSTFIQRLGYKDAEQLNFPDLGHDNAAWYGALLDRLHAGLDEPKVSAATDSELPKAAPEATSSAPGTSATTQPQVGLTQASNPAVKAAPIVNKPDSAKPTGSTPAYPTSSKKGAVNWDKFADDDDNDNDESDSKDGNVNSFFQQLYKDADDDTKRAMMKSYVESNGTSLSTSWAEAKERTYTTQPPDGAEAKKWDD